MMFHTVKITNSATGDPVWLALYDFADTHKSGF